MEPIIEKVWALIFTFCFVTFHAEVLAKKRVCVIGAGRVGLAAVKLVSDKIDKFEAIAFERNSDVGGLWIYRDDPELDEHGLLAHSGIYKSLKTITAKEDMKYPDYDSFTGGDDRGYVSHETFLEYMRNYTDHFKLRRYIQLNTLVTRVTPKNNGQGPTRWRLERQNLNTYSMDEIVCDAVMVCNGRYSKPMIPRIPGIETFPGRMLHSRSYRVPEDFTDKAVVVLGDGASAFGIARDLSGHAKTLYLSIKRTYSKESPDNVKVVRGVVAINGKKLTLQDNSTITADAFIFCTGYVYDFPFLGEDSGIDLRSNLPPSKREFINKKHPSMALIGLGLLNAFPDVFYDDLEYFLKTLEGAQ